MEKNWKKNKFWFIVAGYMAFFCLVAYFLVFRIIGEINYKSEETQKKMINGEIVQAKISSIPNMEKNIQSFTEKGKDFDILLLADGEVDFIKNLESLAENTGNKIALRIEEDKKATKTEADKKRLQNNLAYENYIMMEINLEGGYEEFMNFINKLENMGQYSDIVSIAMKRDLKAKDDSANNAAVFSSSQKDNLENSVKIIKSVIRLAVYIRK